MSNPNTIINDWLLEAKGDLIKNYDNLGLRASGDWANSLVEFSTKNSDGYKIGILGNDYTEQLEQGRRPNSNQSPEALKAWVGWAGSTIIDEWVKDKGLDLNPFAVASSIATQGWDVPNPHNAGGLVTDVITPKRINELNKDLATYYIQDYSSEIIKELQNADK